MRYDIKENCPLAHLLNDESRSDGNVLVGNHVGAVLHVAPLRRRRNAKHVVGAAVRKVVECHRGAAKEAAVQQIRGRDGARATFAGLAAV